MEPQQPSAPDKLPLVLVHGFGCGILQFYKNLDHLHSDRRLYALDLPGFARSTRIPFPGDAEAVEATFVSALERWREGVGLERFVLLGHSLGGFLSLSYAMSHPHRVRHLILEDPWGFPERAPPSPSAPYPSSASSPPYSSPMPIWARIGTVFMSKFNPYTPVRAAGPLGKYFHHYIITAVGSNLVLIQDLIYWVGSGETRPRGLVMTSWPTSTTVLLRIPRRLGVWSGGHVTGGCGVALEGSSHMHTHTHTLPPSLPPSPIQR